MLWATTTVVLMVGIGFGTAKFLAPRAPAKPEIVAGDCVRGPKKYNPMSHIGFRLAMTQDQWDAGKSTTSAGHLRSNLEIRKTNRRKP